MLVPEGVWTPYGIVMCLPCHGPTFRSKTFEGEEWDLMQSAVELKSWNNVTRCHYCDREIQVRESVAKEHNFVLRLEEYNIKSEMTQTGGMMSGASVALNNGDYVLVTYNAYGEDEWLANRLNEENDQVGESFQTTNITDMLEYILELPDTQKV